MSNLNNKKVLKFDKKFYYPIKNGLKTATTRISHKDLYAGKNVDLVFLEDGEFINLPKISVLIESIDKLNFDELTVEHAKLENHLSLESFKDSLKEFYSFLEEKSEVFFIKFKII